MSKYPDLFDRLAESGHEWEPWTEDELKKLAGDNLIRVFRAVEEVSRTLQTTETPYEALCPEKEIYDNQPVQLCRTNFRYTPTSSRSAQLFDARGPEEY